MVAGRHRKQPAAVTIIRYYLGGCGQACICLKRLYIHENIYSAVTDALVAVARSARVGDGFDPDTVLGPVQNHLQDQWLKSAWEEITKSRAIRGRLSNRFSITISPRLGRPDRLESESFI